MEMSGDSLMRKLSKKTASVVKAESFQKHDKIGEVSGNMVGADPAVVSGLVSFAERV